MMQKRNSYKLLALRHMQRGADSTYFVWGKRDQHWEELAEIDHDQFLNLVNLYYRWLGDHPAGFHHNGRNSKTMTLIYRFI